jgi:hypothetical protein
MEFAVGLGERGQGVAVLDRLRSNAMRVRGAGEVRWRRTLTSWPAVMRSVLLAAMFMVYALEFHVAGVRYGFAALSVVNAVVAVREWRREVFVGADGVVIRRVMSPVRAAFGDIARFSLVDLKVRGADAVRHTSNTSPSPHRPCRPDWPACHLGR